MLIMQANDNLLNFYDELISKCNVSTFYFVMYCHFFNEREQLIFSICTNFSIQNIVFNQISS